jgi:hypothetical protein
MIILRSTVDVAKAWLRGGHRLSDKCYIRLSPAPSSSVRYVTPSVKRRGLWRRKGIVCRTTSAKFETGAFCMPRDTKGFRRTTANHHGTRISATSQGKGFVHRAFPHMVGKGCVACKPCVSRRVTDSRPQLSLLPGCGGSTWCRCPGLRCCSRVCSGDSR